MTAWLSGLDDAIAKAGEFAGACRDAEEAVAATALAADDAALLIGAAMGRAAGSTGDLRTALAETAAAAGSAEGAAAGLRDSLVAVAAAEAAQAADATAAAAATGALAGAQRTAAATGTDLARVAAHIKDTFGIVTGTENVAMANSARMASANLSMADSFGLIRSSAANASISAARLAAMNENLTAGERLEAEMAADAAHAQDLLTASRLASIDATLALARAQDALVPAEEKAAAAAAGGGAAMFIGGMRITGQVLHWLVMGTLEVASTAIPALVALGAAAAGLAPTFIGISDQMHNLVTASGSVRGALLNSVGPLHQVGVGAGALTKAMAPDAYIIFGSVISDLTGRVGLFSGVARSAGSVLAAFATKITADLQGPVGAQLAGFFQNSVKYMIQWGQVLGNLGHAFLQVTASMRGVGQDLLDVLVLLSRAFLAVTMNPVAAWLIGVGAAMSAVYRYGKLLVTIWTWLGGTALVSALSEAGSLFLAMAADIGVAAAASQILMDTWGAITAFATGPVGIAIGVIAAGFGLWYLASHQAADATSNLIKSVESAPPTVTNLTKGIGELSGALGGAITQMKQGTARAAEMTARWKGLAEISPVIRNAQADIAHLTAAIGQQARELVNLEIGLAQTHAGTGIVGHDMAMLSVQTGLADSKVSQLTQAFDQWMQEVTGGASGMAAFETSLVNIGTVAGRARNNLGTSTATMSLSVSQFATELSRGFARGAGAWTNFTQVIGSTAPQLVDWLTIARTAGAITSRQFSQGVLDMAAQLAPFAAKSQQAQAMLVAFAQAQGLNITTFPQLQAAIATTHAGVGNLNRIVGSATISMSNLSQVARNLSNVLSSQETAAIASAALATAGFQQKVLALTDAIQHYGANSPQAVAAANAVNSAVAAAGNDAQIATGKMLGLASVLNSLHSKTITLTVNTISTSTLRSMGAAVPGMASGTDSARRGMALVGEQGPELVMMRGGESVVPAGPTRHLMALAGMTHRITGYAAGTADQHADKALAALIARDLAVMVAKLTGTFRTPVPLMGPIAGLLGLVQEAGRRHDITGREETRFTRMLIHDNARLQRLASERAAILNRIHAAEQYATGVTTAAAGTASLSAIMQGVGAGPVSSSFLLASMRIDLAGIRRFDADIRKLAKLGLDRNLLNQVIQMGPAQGDQVAQALINGPLSNISALNQTATQVTRASTQLGQTSANLMFDSGRQAGKGFLSGLRAEQRQIEHLMEQIARDMVRTLRKELKIHSPSAVTRDIGRAVIDGMAGGIGDRLPSLDSSLRSAAAHVPSALSSAAGHGGGGGGVLQAVLPVQVNLDGKVLQRSVQTHTLRVNRRNPDNRLSLTRGRGA